MGGRGRRSHAVALLAALSAVSFAAVAAAAGISGGATVEESAERGAPFQATDTVPPPASCDRVAVVGDSLMDNAAPWLRSELAAAGFEYVVDAQPSRRIPDAVRAPYSGVKAARSIRAAFGEADCWVIALGSNDLVFGADEPGGAAAMVDEMLGALTPSASVWWVNVNYRTDPRTSFDFVAATHTFNRVVAEHASRTPAMTVIDWYTLSEANPDWFFDPVHVDRDASIVRAEFTVAALPRAG